MHARSKFWCHSHIREFVWLCASVWCMYQKVHMVETIFLLTKRNGNPTNNCMSFCGAWLICWSSTSTYQQRIPKHITRLTTNSLYTACLSTIIIPLATKFYITDHGHQPCQTTPKHITQHITSKCTPQPYTTYTNTDTLPTTYIVRP